MTYELDGKTYVQKKLTWGQILQLLPLLQGLEIPAHGGHLALIAALGPRLPRLLAVAVVAEGQTPERTAEELAATEQALAGSPEVMFEALSDFFTCNPVVSLAEKLTGTIQTIGKTLTSPRA